MSSLHRTTVEVRSSSGGTKFLLIASSQEELGDMLDEEVAKALRAGHEVTHADGSREWISAEEFYDPKTHRLTFHEDGNRCLWIRSHVHVSADGTREETKLRSTWRLPEEC